MKANYQMPSLPQNGVQVTLEGPLVRLLFDFTPATPVLEDGEEAPDDLFDCESVDTTDRSYGGIVSAIINDRYSQDRVQAILANYQNAIDPESTIDVDKRAEYLQEYHEFQDYREHAKTVARLAVAKIEE
jgi:hypothetical protein